MILVCDIKPFHYNQQVVIMKDDNTVEDRKDMTLVNLYGFIPEYCHLNNISKVKLFGNKEYNQMVSSQIKNNEKLFYADYTPIEVEVME